MVARIIREQCAPGQRVRLMFQDEARFGRMARAKRCWAPKGQRPVMANGYERQFTYVYGAVSPLEGDFDAMICEKMNTEQMGNFLQAVRERYPGEFIIMIVDGASSHRAKDLRVPPDMHLERLPAYAPELNPQEHLWDELREKEFPNRVFESMEAVISQLRSGLAKLQASQPTIRSITAWPWIKRLNLNAN